MLPCCWRSDTREAVTNGKKSFDDQLLEGFRDVLHRGSLVGWDPDHVQQRILEGKLGVMVRLPPNSSSASEAPGLGPKLDGASSNGSAAAAAATAAPPKDVARRAGPSKAVTNFTQVPDAEKVTVVDGTTLILPSPTPLAVGHILVVPRYTEVLPHVLSEDLLRQALEILAKSEGSDLRLLFDSRGAGAPDHCHFHGLFLSHCSVPDSRLPVEKADRSLVAGSTRQGSASIELLLEMRWYARGFVVCAGARKGAVGQPPLADAELLASVAFRLLTEMQQKGFAHVVLIAPCKEQSKGRKRLDMGSEEEPAAVAFSPEIYIFPLQKREERRAGAAPGLTSWEMSGLITASSAKEFAEMTEDSLKDRFSDVAVSGADFDDLICKAAWM